MARKQRSSVPPDLRARLESARLELLALFRALDRMCLLPHEMPQLLLKNLFDLDADYAEALWALDQPPGTLNMVAMVADTLASLEKLHDASASFRAALAPDTLSLLAPLETAILRSLEPGDAYNEIPGSHPGSR